MTITVFMNNFDIKHKALVIGWIEQGLIPGAVQHSETYEWIIPDPARPPYTKARAKNTNAIYKSIVKACIQRKHVMPVLYNISKTEFQTYIEQLDKAEIIEIAKENGISYYYATPTSEAFLKSNNPAKFIETSISKIVEAASKGATSALIQSFL